MKEIIRNTQHGTLSRSEQAWAKKTSRRIGYSLFGVGSSLNRKKDTKQLYGYLCEILMALKTSYSEFDIDVLSMQEAKQVISDKYTKGSNAKSTLNQFIYENYTSYTMPGLISGGIKVNNQALADLKLKQEFQKLMGNIYSGAVSGISPVNRANFREEKYKRFEAIKKRKHSKNSFEYQKWKHGPRSEQDLELILNGNKYFVPAYSINEIDENNKSYKVTYPIIDAKILELFAKDSDKGEQNLHQWLKDHIKSLKNQIIIADISADISNAYDMGSYLKGINLSGSIIRSLYITDADCRDMNLQNCDILNMSLNKCLYGNLDLRGADTNKLLIDSNSYEDTGLRGFSDKEYQDDNKSYIKLSSANPKKSRDKGIITESLYDALNDRVLLDPFYVRNGEGQYFGNNSITVKVTIEDLQAYIEEINQSDIVKSLKKNNTQKIDWTQSSVPSFVDFLIQKYQYTDKNVYVDISNQDLSKIPLNYGNFRNVNFAGCKIKEAKHTNFFGACLEGVNADNANFTHAIFIQANMQYISAKAAIFEQVNMNDANLERAYLVGIKGQFQARRANMRFANLENAEIDKSVLSLMRAEGITLAHAHANYCQMRGAKMANAILKGGKFKGTDFTKAIFKSANAELAEFSNSIMEHINAERANFRMATMAYVEAQGANFSHADMEAIQISYSNFSDSLINELNAHKAKLYAVSLENAEAIGANFEEAILDHIQGKDLDLAFATLDRAKVKRSVLINSYMNYIQGRKAHFEECYIKEANLKFSDFMGAEFVKTYLKGSKIQGTDLTNVNIKNSDLSGVEYDDTTSVVGIKNQETARLDKDFKELCKKQYREAFPIRSRCNDTIDWCNKKANCFLNIFQDLIQLFKSGLLAGISGGMLGFIIGVGIIALLVPTAGVALTMALCMGGTVIGTLLSMYYNSDTTALSNHFLELVGLKTCESNIDVNPECISEERIEEIHQEILNVKNHTNAEQQQYVPDAEMLKIIENMTDINTGYVANLEEINRVSSATLGLHNK
ncbi:Pentapeptide repeat protein [Rickettsiales bacterium Ac37b]|nr:Pentapeptide repeat protein [Rickettsiales bacterium Ac37b]